MTAPAPTHSHSAVSGRRVGHVADATVNGILLFAVNVWPGWQMVPFLTTDTRHVLTAVNFVLVVALVTSLAFAVYETPSFRAFGNLVMLGFGGAALVRLWQVFPLDFGDSAFDWALVARVFLIAGLVGTGIGIIVNFVALLRETPEG